MRNHHQKETPKSVMSYKLKRNDLYSPLRLCKYHIFESLILAQDERWRRA